jgi:hypothetical protein
VALRDAVRDGRLLTASLREDDRATVGSDQGVGLRWSNGVLRSVVCDAMVKMS